jgi:hypothetical protein
MNPAVFSFLSLRHVLPIPSRVLSAVLLIILVAMDSCSSDNDPAVAGQPACQLVRQTSTVNATYAGDVTYVSKAIYSWTYDDRGNIIGSTNTSNATFSDGKTAQSTYSTNYQFDNENFLVRTVSQSNSLNRDGTTYKSNSNEEMTYENGRLIKDAYTSSANGTPQNYAVAYEYDAGGKLIKYINTYDNSTTVIEYNGATVTKLTRTDAAGNTTSPFLQYNDKGWLIKGIEYTGGYADENRYEYTTDGAVLREERYIDGKPSSGNVYEYDNKVNPSYFMYANPKGHPIVPSTRANWSYKHNYTKYTGLDAAADNTGWVTRATGIYLYDYNDKGFPTGYTTKTVDSKGVELSSEVVTYEYANCP